MLFSSRQQPPLLVLAITREKENFGICKLDLFNKTERCTIIDLAHFGQRPCVIDAIYHSLSNDMLSQSICSVVYKFCFTLSFGLCFGRNVFRYLLLKPTQRSFLSSTHSMLVCCFVTLVTPFIKSFQCWFVYHVQWDYDSVHYVTLHLHLAQKF